MQRVRCKHSRVHAPAQQQVWGNAHALRSGQFHLALREIGEIHHFGAGNTPGDTVVYDPETKTAWTGNLVIGEGTVPPVFEGNGRSYLRTLAKFRSSLDIDTVVPGHGFITDGSTIDRYMAYLGAVVGAVQDAEAKGASVEDVVAAALPIEAFHPLPQEIRASDVGNFLAGLHRLNVQQIYLNGTDG